MATNKYIDLYDSSSGSGGAFFRVVEGGYKPEKDKGGQINQTAGGGLDVSVGDIYEIHQYLIRVREDETEVGYGDLAELERLWSLNDPGGTPSNILTLIDHYGVTHQVYFMGKFSRQPVSVIIEGQQAWFMIPCTFVFIP